MGVEAFQALDLIAAEESRPYFTVCALEIMYDVFQTSLGPTLVCWP